MRQQKRKINNPCPKGLGYGREEVGPHEIKFATTYDDHSRHLLGVRLTIEGARNAYTCRKCGMWQGCGVCIRNVASLICSQCHDWANDISEKVHGPLVRDRQFRDHAMKLVLMFGSRTIDFEDYTKLWNEAKVASQARADDRLGVFK